MPILSLSEFSPQDVKLMKERARLDKKRDFSLIRERATLSVDKWVAVCEHCHVEIPAAGGVAASSVADEHLRMNRAHNSVALYVEHDGHRCFVMRRDWRPDLGFENEDIRR